VSLVTSPVCSGRRALRTVDDSGSAVTVLSRDMPVSRGETLRVTAQARVVSGRASSVYLPAGRWIQPELVQEAAAVVGVSGWQAVAVEMAAPNDALTAPVRIYSSIDATGTTSGTTSGYVPAWTGDTPRRWALSRRARAEPSRSRQMRLAT
jgi:hypothetical protein